MTQLDRSDLLKILDVLHANAMFHKYRDRMNGEVHLAKECRYSPLTSETFAAEERLADLLDLPEEAREARHDKA
jgi:hypothetical protein